MPLPPLLPAGVVIGAEVSDWRDAVRTAGDALTASGATTRAYSGEMVRMIEEHGPYVVIAPGLALAHARPGPEVLADGLAIVTLKTPVAFGHPHNDPVKVVVGLSAVRADTHLPAIAAIANIFNDNNAIAALVSARTAEQVLDILGVDGGH